MAPKVADLTALPAAVDGAPVAQLAETSGDGAAARVAELGVDPGAEDSEPVARLSDVEAAPAESWPAARLHGVDAHPEPARVVDLRRRGAGRPAGAADERRGRDGATAGQRGGAAMDERRGWRGAPADERAERRGEAADGAEDPRRSSRGRGRWGRGQAVLDPGVDPVEAAREICLRLLTDRARTRHELADALRRKGVPDAAAATVLERFDEVGLIDDAAFAGQWVRSRRRSRGLARRAIAMELRRKGVADEVAGEALDEIDDESEAKRARELVDRKLRSLAVDTPEQQATASRRLVGMLARKGYGAGLAYGVVRDALAEHGAELEELASEPPADA